MRSESTVRCSSWAGFCGLLIAISLTLPFAANPLHADELGALLERLDLKQLRTAHVEKVLAQTINVDAQKRLQKTLANLYVAQLDDFVESPKEFAAVVKRLEELENKVQDLTKPEILFQRLETEFRHGEFLLGNFREDRRKVSLLVQINDLFSGLAERFDALGQSCEKRIESLEKLDAGVNSLENLKTDNEIDRLSELSFRASFYAGWAFFNVGISKQDSKLGRIHFRRALESFCTFLDINPEQEVSSWDAAFLELSSTRSCQAFLGVALSYLALGQNTDADACFEMIRGPDGAPAIQNQVAFWQIQSLMEFGKPQAALELAKAYLERTDTLNAMQRGQIGLCLIRFAYGAQKRTAEHDALGILGFTILAQLKQFSLTNKLLEEYSVKLPRPSFYSDWIEGQRAYHLGEKSGLETDYLKAAQQLKAAMAQGKDIPVADLESCRYQLGWAYYKGSKFQQAADCFELVIARMARLDPNTAAVAAWLQHDCYLKQSKDNPTYTKRALAILENLVTRFPESDLTKKARLQIVKLRQTSMKAEDAVTKLKEVVGAAPNDVLSRYELCLAIYRKYVQRVQKKQDTSSVEVEIAESISELEKSTGKLSAHQKLRLALIELDLVTRNKKGSPDTIDGLISKAESAAADVDNKLLLAELHYRQFQIARDRKDQSGVSRHVAWLIENGDGTVYQRSVLVTRAQRVETDLKNSPTGDQRKRAVKDAIDVYLKLARATGYNTHSIQTNRNSRVAVSRLAALLKESGDTRGALRNLELLVKAFPTNVGYLQRYARILSAEANYGDALDYWRTLSKGLESESDAWFEAKYNMLKCLVKTDLAAAKPPLKQFVNLYEIPPDWKPRFDQLVIDSGLNL